MSTASPRIIHLAAAVICLVLLHPFLSGFTTKVVGDDSLEVNYPQLVFQKAALSAGHFPYWNPYAQAGTPDFASPFYDLFYPLHWLIFLFPIEMGINVSFLIHGAIGWIGAFLFFRTFASSVASSVGAWLFMLCAPILQFPQGGYLGTFYSVVALPWCLWLIHRALTDDRPRRAVAWALTAGVVLALCMNVIASYALIFDFLPAVLLIVCAGAPVRRRLTTLASFGLCAAFAALARIWPWYLLTLETHRSGAAADLSFSAAGSVHPLFALNYFLPNFLPPLQDSGLTVRGYGAMPWPIAFGLIPLAMMAREVWRRPHGKFLILLYAGAASMVFGVYSPVFLFCFYFLPGFSVTTHPNIYTWMAAMAACGLIVMMLNGEGPRTIRARRWILVVAGCAALTAVCLAFLPVEARLLEYFLDNRASFSPGNVVRMAAVFARDLSAGQVRDAFVSFGSHLRWERLAWAVVWVIAIFASLRPPVIRPAAVIALLGVDLLFHPLPAWQMTRPADYFPHTAIHDRLARLAASPGAEPFRVYPSGGPYNTPFFKFNQGAIRRVESIKGETGFLLKNSGYYFNRIQDWPLSVKKRYPQFYGTMRRVDSRLIDLLNVRYVISDTPMADRDLTEVDSADGLFLYENGRSLPRAYLSRRVERLSSRADVFAAIESDTYNPRSVLYAGPDAPADDVAPDTSPVDGDLVGNISVVRAGPNALSLTIDAPSGGWVCVSEPFVPGWSVTTESGESVRTVEVNGMMTAFRAPAGRTGIQVEYTPAGMAAGAWASVGALMVWAASWIAAFRQRKEV